jgi:thiol-disulfide isomerase/thioredoxin
MKNCLKVLMVSMFFASTVFSTQSDASSSAAKLMKHLKLDAMHEKAPDFEYANAEGVKFHLSDLLGKPIVIHFWASWCTSCAKELPLLQTATQKWMSKPTRTESVAANHDIVFLPVSVEGIEKKSQNVSFLKENAPELSYWVPTEAKTVHKYWAWGLPATYFINRKGQLVARSLGARDWNTVSGNDILTLLDLP